MLPILKTYLPPCCNCLHSFYNIVFCIARSICDICLLEVSKDCDLEHSSRYFLLILLLGEMLDIATYGPDGGKLHLLFEG
jgi:hypothetical protein